MFDTRSLSADPADPGAADGQADPSAQASEPRGGAGGGSRRRRLWDLPARAHCPVVGLCLPIPVLRRVVEKTFKGRNIDKDHALHSGAVGECRSRTVLADAMQRELDQRFALPLRQASRIKNTAELAQWWSEQMHTELPGALWAVLTHPRCSPELEQQALGEVHMLQHELGADQRQQRLRIGQLEQDRAGLSRQVTELQGRLHQLQRDSAAESEAQRRQIVQLRADLLAREHANQALRLALQDLSAARDEDRLRQQADELARQAQRILALEGSLRMSRGECERLGRQVSAQAAEITQLTQQRGATPPAAPASTPRLDARSILCVGGRTSSVPHYRQVVENTGGRFLHHDGGAEESVNQLDATLAAADLVICQTGCISHNAYWRIKDHCKRTGKPCLFVDNPGTAGIKRALLEALKS